MDRSAHLAKALWDSVWTGEVPAPTPTTFQSTFDTGRNFAAISQALDSRKDQEVSGGICELNNLLNRLDPATRLPPPDLLPQLRKLSARTRDDIGPLAQNAVERLFKKRGK